MPRLTAEERETVINMCDADRTATIYSEQRPMIRRLRKLHRRSPSWVEVLREGRHWGVNPYIEVRLPVEFVSVRLSRAVKFRTRSWECHLAAPSVDPNPGTCPPEADSKVGPEAQSGESA